MRTTLFVLPALALFSLAACAQTPSDKAASADSASAAAPTGECRPDAASALVGQALPSEARTKELTGATIVRVAGPDDALTQDFRVERVTIIVDPQTKKVIRAGCN